MTALADQPNRTLWALVVAGCLFAFWLLLSGGQGVAYAGVFALAGGFLSAWLAPGTLHRVRPIAILGFLALFVRQSLVGGVDVAWRALHPQMPMDPGWSDYRIALRTPAAKALFQITVSLTPGTLCADLRGGVMRVHTLTPAMDAGLPQVERAIAAIFSDEAPGSAG